jgi:hypothetical protein
VQKSLGALDWEKLPECKPDPMQPGRYIYVAEDWSPRKSVPVAGNKRKRLSSKASLAKGQVATPSLPKPKPEASKSPSLPARIVQPLRQAGWPCPLLGRSLGKPVASPAWFNDPLTGVVDVRTGTQEGLTCGLFAVSHCLAQKSLGLIPHAQFCAKANGGFYPEGDFDDGALRLNLRSKRCYFDLLQGADHQEAIVQLGDTGNLAMFNGDHVLGMILHRPSPRHWFALVKPPSGTITPSVAALLCDSLFTCIFELSVEDVQDSWFLFSQCLSYSDMVKPTLC